MLFLLESFLLFVSKVLLDAVVSDVEVKMDLVRLDQL